ncbi:ABC transporter substrate-binding protein [Streptomyces turgidiscabies]|uniref:ABC transporter, substrate-binding protein n=1 Tax=Streptomyces turgidiscabies (strain Car8) TaxID=698760 RepID=L7FAN6_STRT8|nr:MULTISPECIES: extracellular solute-binding protein [Streptomyces]ELP68628.1 ABC transporter, substrate-binding protein [Streptomyces turgidiscabies Car8]MDX3494079.1 extracellular solute-binding protein [Streptomyces turgidiscabies]GAQ68550.1 bacterial extracellular solute-binding protein [Streptomyces turgidiscabies]
MNDDVPVSSRRQLRHTAVAVLGAVSLLALAACGSADPTPAATSSPAAFKPVEQQAGSEITVWADAGRVPGVQAYQKAHPDVKMKIVTYSGDANGANDLQTKVQLFDRTGSGWPDVAFSANVNDGSWASQGKTPYAAPVNRDIIRKTTLDGFADGALNPCTFNGDTYCLRNDLAQNVLWYNKKLLDKFGYSVPATWEEYEALGKKVAEEHPGYLVGTAGDAWSPEVYFWASQCPASTATGAKQVKVDLRASQCTRMAELLDNLIAKGSVSKDTVFSAGFIKDKANKVLMLPGPSWFGQVLFNSTFKIPKGQIAAASPLKFESDAKNYTGNVGGGLWFVSSHSKNLKAASDLVTWMATSDDYQATAGTYPAYKKAAVAWLAGQKETGYFAEDVGPVFQEAAELVWPGWSATQYSQEAIYSSTVIPALNSGKTLTDTLGTWQTAITDKAKSLGYTVN